MSSNFYRAFEDKYRGSRETIKSRLEVYLPFIEGLRRLYPQPYVLDLGCGRGEWLQLLREQGVETVKGVDLDKEMLNACHELGLGAAQGDALEYLKGQPGKSVAVISAFHFVEHIPFPLLRDLVSESCRVLKPGGLLIMETPNPDNLVVGSSGFYLDPTHKRPIPAPLLSFLVAYHGFSRHTVMGLQEPEDAGNTECVTLLKVLSDVSPDYAVVAQSPMTEDQPDALEKAFMVSRGVSLARIAQSFDQALDSRFNDVILRLAREAGDRNELSLRLNRKFEQVNTRVTGQVGDLDAKLGREMHSLNVKLASLDQELRAVYASASWRVTWPLRKVVDAGYWLCRIPVRVMRRLARAAFAFVTARPKIATRLSMALDQRPRLKERMIELAVSAGWDPTNGSTFTDEQKERHSARKPNADDVRENTIVSDLPGDAYGVYQNLKTAMNKAREKDV